MSKGSIRYLFIAFIFVVVICGIALRRKPDSDPFMVASTLFTGLAFAGVIWTVLMQREELELQRQELVETRKVFEDQGKTQSKQRFENTFFQLVAVHNQKASDFRYGNEKTSAASFTKLFVDVKSNSTKLTVNPPDKRMMYAYSKIKSEGAILEIIPYENNLFNLLAFVRSSELIDDSERPFYINVLASQLSNGEIHLMWIEANVRGDSDKLESEGFFEAVSDALLPKKGGSSNPMLIK